MFRVILLQVVVTVCAALAAGLVVGVRGAVSAAAGGMACVVPNFLFALHLTLTSRRRGASPVNFLVGEFAKLILTVVLLFLLVRIYAGLHWPSMLTGLVLATQAMFLAFWIKN